ncbi:hypothetical protein ACG9XW_22145 [Acinetobacter guillouiae]|uniref:hypothetical protein n=1 Tax=Acinetobacter guillouiae TaxID=106649 RepID=UPI003AF74853
MTCNCKETLTEKLLSNAKRNLPESNNHEITLTGYTTVINKETLDLSCRGFMNIEIRHKAINRKTGNSIAKKIKEPLIFKHCPWCGVAYKEPQQ